MQGKNVKAVKIISWLVALSLTLCTCVFFGDSVINICAFFASWSAKTYLPQKGITLVAKTTADYTATETDDISETESTTKTEKTSAANTTAAESTQEAVAAVAALSKTDSDIKKLMKEYDATQQEKGGNIKSKTYTNEGATDIFGRVIVKNTNKTQIDIGKILSEKADLSVNKDEPSVLIFHTHTTETYQIPELDYYAADFAPRSESEQVNMVRVGKAICEQLEKAGYKVIHDTEIHDGTYGTAYAHSRKAVEAYLEKYPSIKIVLDIHRDAIQLEDGTKIKPVAEIDGKNAAQIMIISGCQEDGNGITNLPDWKYNLTFALHLQNELEKNFSGITRPLYFCARSYNMNVSHCSLLVEVGSDSNTLDEAVYSGKCLGVALSKLMDTYCEK